MKIVKKIREVVLLMLFISIPYLSMEDRNQNADGQLSRLESSRDQNKGLDPYQNGLFANKKLESTVTHQRDNRHLFHLNGFTVKENDDEYDLEEYIEKKTISDQKLAMVRASTDKKNSLLSSITSIASYYLNQEQVNGQPVTQSQGFALTMQSQEFALKMQSQEFALKMQSQEFGPTMPSQAAKKLEFGPQNQSQSQIKPEAKVASMGSPIKPEAKVASMGSPIKPEVKVASMGSPIKPEAKVAPMVSPMKPEVKVASMGSPIKPEAASPIKPVCVQQSQLLQGSLRDSPKKLGSGVEATKNSAFSKVQPRVGVPVESPRPLFQLQSQIQPQFKVPSQMQLQFKVPSQMESQLKFQSQMESPVKFPSQTQPQFKFSSQTQPPVELVQQARVDERNKQLFEKTKAIKKEIEKKCRCAELLFIEKLEKQFNINKQKLNNKAPLDIKQYLKNKQSALINTMNAEKNKYDSFYKPDCLLNGEESLLSNNIQFTYSKYDYNLPNSNTFTFEYNNNEFS